MSQMEIEVILSRHLAEYLAMPIFIVDPEGSLLYYNEQAEIILGLRYIETGVMPASEWSTIFKPFYADGKPMAPEELPLIIALSEQHPAHKNFWIKGLNGSLRQLEVTAIPLIGQAERFMGAIAIFWEVTE
jgi:PAS domain-containing protein